MRPEIQKYLGFDLRSLATLRVGVALVILFDLAFRATDLAAHYSDSGILPRHALLQDGSYYFHISLHHISGYWMIQAALFIIAAIFGIMLLIGYRTRIVSVISWVFLLSLQNRNPGILHSGDTFFLMILFWGMFLPWGAVWSLDKKNDPGNAPVWIFNLATLAYLLQIIYIYWFAFLEKMKGIEWMQDFSAVYFALNIDYLVTPFGHSLLQYPLLLKTLTIIVLAFEAIGPLLLIIPWKNHYFRLVSIIGFILMHAGFALTMQLGIFPWISSIAMLAFLPGKFWRFSFINSIKSKIKPFVQKVLHELEFLNTNTRFIIKEHIQLSGLQKIILILLIIYITWWNISVYSDKVSIPPQLASIAYTLRLDQGWGMFAPFPLKDDGWYVVPGELESGSKVNLMNFEEVIDWKKPAVVSATTDNSRWASYLWWFLREKPEYYSYYAEWLCRKWNTKHPDRPLKKIGIIYMLEYSLPDYQKPIPEKVSYGEFECQ